MVSEVDKYRIEDIHKRLRTALGKAAYMLNHPEKAEGMIKDIEDEMEQIKIVILNIRKGE